MTKREFAKKWDSDDNGGGITIDDIAECAIAWGVSATPKAKDLNTIIEMVVRASGAKS